MPTLRARSLDDPSSRAVIAALAAVGAGRSTVVLPEPSATFRADLRTQLVAVAPRLVGEGVSVETEVPARHRRNDAPAPARRSARTRVMTVLVAATAVVVLGLGGATWLARSALPGDPLYGLKRTAESVDVSLSGNDVDKGTTLLLDATTRVQEVDDLLNQPQSMAFGSGPAASGALSASTIKLVVSTLQAADSNTRKGVTTIGDDAIEHGNAAGLKVVVDWAAGQKTSIAALVQRIPDSATKAKAQAQTSYEQISFAYTRASDLYADVTNGVTCQHQRDAFGPKPCSASTTPGAPSSSPSPSGSPSLSPSAPGSGGPSGTGTNSGGSTPGSAVPSVTPTGSGTGTGTASSTSTDSPNATLSTTLGAAGPPAGTSSPDPVVAVGSCGAEVSLPVGEASLGTCTPDS